MSNKWLDYRPEHSLAIITNGPGTQSLRGAKPGDRFSFGGTKLVEGEYRLGTPRQLVDVQRCGGDEFNLWFQTNDYPIFVERMVYNGCSRSGLSALWKKPEDGFIQGVSADAFWVMAVLCAAITLPGLISDGAGGKFLMWFGVLAAEFTALALRKHADDDLNRAFECLNALDLRVHCQL